MNTTNEKDTDSILNQYPLFDHQLDAIQFFNNVAQGLDFSDPGTGKTRTQIELFRRRRRTGAGCALIIAPKSILQSAWGEDIKKFAPELTYIIANAGKRDVAFSTEADIYITNTDAATWLAKQKPRFFQRFSTIIVDEISTFKHRTSQRSKALKKISPRFEYRYGLTGTPNANHILEVWHQVLVIDDGAHLGRSFFSYRNNVATPVQVGPSANMLRWDEKPGAAIAIADVLSDMTFRVTLDECHDIPENHVYPVRYTLTKPQRDVYEELAEYAISQVHTGAVINAVNAAALATKLLQVASGAVYDESGTATLVDDGRYQLIGQLCNDRTHSLVFFNWRHQKENLVAEFNNHKITYAVIDGTVPSKERSRIVSEFQRGYYRVLLAHPQSAAHGLTLTKGTSCIWASPTYNLEHFVQGNRRIVRAGQTNKTETILVTAAETIEEQVYEKLNDKNVKQVDFLQTIKDLA